MAILTKDDFKEAVAKIQSEAGYREPVIFGLFIAQYNSRDEIISGHFLTINYKEHFGTAAILLAETGAIREGLTDNVSELVVDLDYEMLEQIMNVMAPFVEEAVGGVHRNVQALQAMYEHSGSDCVAVFVFDTTVPVQSIPAAYLRMQAYDRGLDKDAGAFCADGLKDVLKPMWWEGNVATDPADIFLEMAAGAMPMWEDEPHLLPPYMRKGRLNDTFLRLIERQG